MKTIILAGGRGTRLAEETEVVPKPMIEIGGRPILWHIMKHYAHYRHNEFFIALGYKGDVIKRYFLDYRILQCSDLTVNLRDGSVNVEENVKEDEWIVHFSDTGTETLTGGRVKRLERFIGNETFMITYGDGVSNVNIDDLLKFHHDQKRLVTVTAVRPPARFGGIIFEDNLVKEFTEKSQIGEGWINGGFLVCEPSVFDYIDDDSTSLEGHVLEQLAKDGQLAAYRHPGFWQCMDTLREKQLLARMWQNNNAPWKVW